MVTNKQVGEILSTIGNVPLVEDVSLVINDMGGTTVEVTIEWNDDVVYFHEEEDGLEGFTDLPEIEGFSLSNTWELHPDGSITLIYHPEE